MFPALVFLFYFSLCSRDQHTDNSVPFGAVVSFLRAETAQLPLVCFVLPCMGHHLSPPPQKLHPDCWDTVLEEILESY